jgi:hypothetical protein
MIVQHLQRKFFLTSMNSKSGGMAEVSMLETIEHVSVLDRTRCYGVAASVHDTLNGVLSV